MDGCHGQIVLGQTTHPRMLSPSECLRFLLPNIETILFHESHPEIIAKEDPNIKTEPNLDDFDLQAFL